MFQQNNSSYDLQLLLGILFSQTKHLGYSNVTRKLVYFVIMYKGNTQPDIRIYIYTHTQCLFVCILEAEASQFFSWFVYSADRFAAL